MICKTIDNTIYSIDISLETDFDEISLKLREIIKKNIDITFINKGKIIDAKSTVEQEGLNNSSTVIIVIKDAQEDKLMLPHLILVNIGKGIYEKKYTGKEIKSLLSKPMVFLNLLHAMGQQNPFFLSYLAVNPLLAHSYLYQNLDNPEFKVIVKCDDKKHDPIYPFMEEFNIEEDIDYNNIKYITTQTSNKDEDYVKRTYLSYKRDITKTLNHLTNLRV